MKQNVITVLIIEPNENDRRLYRRMLLDYPGVSFGVEESLTGKEGMEALDAKRFQCVLLAWRLPDMEGSEWLRSMRGKKSLRETPVLMLIRHQDEMAALQSLVGGASDYMIKEFINKDFLSRTILYSIEKTRNSQLTRRYQGFIETLIDTIPYPFFYKDENNVIIGSNFAFEKLLGLPGSEIIGKKENELLALDGEMEKTAGSGDFQTVNSCPYESSFRNIKGETFDVLCHRGGFTQADGSMSGSVCVMADITGMKSIERELRTFRRAVEQSPASILITDVNGVIQYVNPKFTEVTGYASVDAVGKKPSILKSGTQSRDFYSELWDTILNGRNWIGEFHNMKKNGELFWELASISPILDDRGNITHLIAIKEDITHLKQMEVELKESEEKLRVLFESLTEGIAVIGLDGKVQQVNAAFIAQHRHAYAGDAEGSDIGDIITIKAGGGLKAAMDDALRRGQSDIVEYRIPGPGASMIDAELSVAILKDRQYRPWGYVVATRDISERKIAERALRDSEERNREILEAIPDLMFRIDADGNYRDAILVPKVKKVFPPEIIQIVLPLIREALDSGEIRVHEYPVYSDGDLQYYEARFIVSGAEEVLVILRNISERIIAEEQLKKARDDAESANRAKSEFLANMSHEIRTPLNSVLGFIELLQRTELSPTQSEYLDIVSGSAAGLLGIINDILDYSKIESGKMEVDAVSFDPVREFESVINLFTVKANQKDIGLLTYIDPRLPLAVTGDPLRIKQVLNNLLSNAIKFTPVKGTIKLEIRETGREDGRCSVHFSVADNGIGIDANKRRKIFEAFSQADSSVARKYGGTGLGLSISANLLSLMGSSLELKSVKGKGSDFYFTINFRMDRPLREDFLRPDIEKIRIGLLSGGEDTAELEEYLHQYLKTFRFTVSRCRRIEDLESGKGVIAMAVYSPVIPESRYREIRSAYSLPLILVVHEKHRGDLEALRPYVAQMIFQPVNPSKLFNAIIDTVAEAPKAAAGFEGATAEPVQAVYGARVLVAEDNRINQKLIRLMLEEFAVESEIARNGLEAIEKFESARYDLVFLDINMPVYDGIEAAKLILEYEAKHSRDHVPLVALTAKAMKGDRESLLAQGFDDYLSKPLGLADLGRVLERFCAHLKGTGKAAGKGQGGTVDTERGATYSLERTSTILGIPRETLKEILREFFGTKSDYLNEIGAAVVSGDKGLIADSAHRLKGISANLQFTGLASLCAAMEGDASAGKDSGFKVMLDEIDKTITMLEGELKGQLER